MFWYLNDLIITIVGAVAYDKHVFHSYISLVYICYDKSIYLQAVLKLTKDENLLVVGDCYNMLVNLSCEPHIINNILESYNIVPEFLRLICDPDCQYAHKVAMIMNNLTRSPEGSKIVANSLPDFNENCEENVPNIDKLIEVFCKSNYNKHKLNLDYIAPFLSNLCQVSNGLYYASAFPVALKLCSLHICTFQ